jgi:hypothetical protein
MTTQQERLNEALHILHVLGMPKELLSKPDETFHRITY